MKFSKQGYRNNSPDIDKSTNIIQGGHITMEGVDFKVLGIDDRGSAKVMYPGYNYYFPHAKWVKDYNENVINKQAIQILANTNEEEREDMANRLMYELIGLSKVAHVNRNRLFENASWFSYLGDMTSTLVQTTHGIELDQQSNLRSDLKKLSLMQDVGLGENRLPYKLSHLPHNSSIGATFNDKFDQYLAVSKAIQLNYDPSTLEYTGMLDNFLTSIPTHLSGEKVSSIADQIVKDYQAGIISQGGTFTDEELVRAEDRTIDLIASGTSGLLIFVGEMALLRQPVTASLKMMKNFGTLVNFGTKTSKYIRGSRYGKHMWDVGTAAIKEVALGTAVDQFAHKVRGQEKLGTNFWLAVGVGGALSKKIYSKLLKGEVYGTANIMSAINKSQVAKGIFNGTLTATMSTGTLVAAEIFDGAMDDDGLWC